MSRTLLVIVVLSVLLKLLLFGGIFFNAGEEGLFLNDSSSFYRTAQNLIAGHGFSREADPPYTPSAHFPPVYPLLLAASLQIAGSVVPLIILQIVLSSLLPLLVWKIGEFLTQNKTALALAAGLAGLEPIGALWSVLVLTEIVAVFFLLTAVLFFLKALREEKYLKYASLAGAALAFSTLTRPNAQLLFIPAILLLVFLGWRYRPVAKAMVLSAAVFALAFFAVLSPWLWRNWQQFGTISVATTGARNFYTSLGTSVISFEKNLTYEEAQEFLDNQFREKYQADPREIRENPAWGPRLAKDGILLMLDYPASTAKVFLITLNSFFTQDLYITNAKHFGLVPQIPFGFSPSVVLAKEGPIELAKLIWERLGAYSALPILGRILWVALTILWVLGFWRAFRQGGEARFAACIFLAIILYYAATSSIAGFSDHGRHRYPANAFIFILAAYGATQLLITKRFSRRQ